MPWALAIFYQSTSFASPTASITRWTMSVDNVDLKLRPFGDHELHGHSHLFSSVYTEVVPGRAQQSITNFT